MNETKSYSRFTNDHEHHLSTKFNHAVTLQVQDLPHDDVRKMGYDFHVSTAEITPSDSKLQLRLTVLNQGVAPFYQDWSLEMGALDADGKIVHRWPLDWKITGLLPGDDAREWKATLNLPEKSLTGLKLGLRVIHPLPNGKQLRIANAEQDRHASGWLSLGKIP